MILNKKGSVSINCYLGVLLIVLLCVILIFTIIPRQVHCNAAKNISEKFVESLTKGDYDTAEAMALGEVKFNIATNKERKFESQIINIRSKTIEVNKNAAITEVIVEYKLQETVNLTALKLYLFNDGENKYKVFKIEEINPYFDKGIGKINEQDGVEIKNCFVNYVKGIERKNYMDSSKYLVGRAKMAHNQTSELIKNANFIIDSKDFKFEYIYGSKDNIIIKFCFINNNKNVDSIVSFYKTSEGWKIYDISQI